MSYFLLPKILLSTNPENINLTLSKKNNDVISITLKQYLIKIKKKIEKYPEKWDEIKKQTNPYEYIHTVIPSLKYSISKYKPISRSYFKMIEISKLLNIFGNYDDKNIYTLSLCEGPGGFIEAISNMRQNKNDKYYGITLQSDTNDIPNWKKINLLNKKNIIIENGIDNTGNILKIENLIYCYEQYKNKFEIITGDGGIDFSQDFDEQENNSLELILGQVCFGVLMQKYGGNFVLKIFDVHSSFMIDILYFLSSLYNKTYIIKPNTSRYGNSERYIVCKNFKLKCSSCYFNKFCDMYKLLEKNKKNKKISSIFSFNKNYLFFNKLEEINSIIGQQQIEMINNTLNIIETGNKEKLEQYKKININRSVQWCIKYNVEYNNNTDIFENSFIPNS